MVENNQRRRKYLYLDEWTKWLKEEWSPLAHNDIPHLKTDVKWLKFIGGGILLAIIIKLVIDFLWG